jgi:ElaB/YqjD/DUF883 family membrane-anchored ribosome-binding protein
MEVSGKDTQNPPDASRGFARDVDEVGRRAHDAIDYFADAASPAVDRAASGAHQAVGRIGRAAEALGAKSEQLKQVQMRAMEQSRGHVRDNPMAALVIALAVGFLLSRLLRSR